MQPPSTALRRLFWPGVVLFALPSAICTYFLMPFVGSQEPDVIGFVYVLRMLIWPLRIVGLLMIAWPAAHGLASGGWKRRTAISLGLVLCGGLYFLSDYYLTAEQLFQEPVQVVSASGSANQVAPETIVLGVTLNGESRAYPVRMLAFHHKVHDTLGGRPILATYCSMCRTGRVYDPVIDDKVQHFRIVGARMYDVVFEDNETKSWWYQATGEAVAGPRAGRVLQPIASEEVTLKSWLALHPQSSVFQPDPASAEGYAMFGFSRWDSVRPPKAYFDSTEWTWRSRSWVIGMHGDTNAMAFPWSSLVKLGVINSDVNGVPVVLTIEPDSISYHAWRRSLNGITLTFVVDSLGVLRDVNSNSTWDWSGSCTSGTFLGARLTGMRASKEYWHSWKTFHPRTGRWEL